MDAGALEDALHRFQPERMRIEQDCTSRRRHRFEVLRASRYRGDDDDGRRETLHERTGNKPRV
jgi:hypothetical protein